MFCFGFGFQVYHQPPRWEKPNSRSFSSLSCKREVVTVPLLQGWDEGKYMEQRPYQAGYDQVIGPVAGRGDTPQLLTTVFVHSGCCNKLSVTGWLLKNGNLSLTVLAAGGGMSKIKALAWLRAGTFLLAESSHAEGTGKLCGASFIVAPILITRALPL